MSYDASPKFDIGPDGNPVPVAPPETSQDDRHLEVTDSVFLPLVDPPGAPSRAAERFERTAAIIGRVPGAARELLSPELADIRQEDERLSRRKMQLEADERLLRLHATLKREVVEGEQRRLGTVQFLQGLRAGEADLVEGFARAIADTPAKSYPILLEVLRAEWLRSNWDAVLRAVEKNTAGAARERLQAFEREHRGLLKRHKLL